MKSLIYKILLLLLFCTTSFSSNSVKISIVERVTQFIQWPKLEEEFVIGIYKNKELKKEMEEVYINKRIHKLPIKVININNSKDKRLKKLNLLYFTKESSKNVDLIFKQIKNSPILIITEFPDDVYQGMHLGLYYKNRKIKFVINQESLESAQLKASYKILKLAKIVKEEDNNE